jgi:phage terminase small subunit
MPARKPTSLSQRHDTAADRTHRADAESALTPKTELTLKPPADLKGNPVAQAEWKRVIERYNELQGKIATSLDLRLVIAYCEVISEQEEHKHLIRELQKAHADLLKTLKKTKVTPDNFKEIGFMWEQLNKLTSNLKGWDARLDGKRKHRYELEQALYLTPRSRAGVTPEEKPKEKPKSAMDNLLDAD